MLDFLNAPVIRPENKLSRKFITDSYEYILWRHRAFAGLTSILSFECMLLVTLDISLVWLGVRTLQTMQKPAAHGAGLGLIMVLVVIGLGLSGWRLWFNAKQLNQLGEEGFLLEERLGDDEG